jgi:hypothetical protein
MCTVKDGSIIDTKGWQGWEWTHGIALTALYHVSTHLHLDQLGSGIQNT